MRQWPSLIGQKFGMLTVVGQAESSAAGSRRWLCRCDCGRETVVLGSNLTRGTTVSCGCRKYKDLAGQKIGRLTVLERSDQWATRGSRRRQLWKCLCDCGEITYKATDTLTNPDISMCRACAAAFAVTQARASAGYTEGTQLSKIQNFEEKADNLSGVRGVYLDGKTGHYRARIRFQGKLYNLGSYTTLEDAVKARRRGEEEYFGQFLHSIEQE